MRVVRVQPKGGNGQVVRVPSFFDHEERLDAELIFVPHYHTLIWTANV